MKISKTLSVCIVLLIAACNASKKATSTTSSASTSTSTNTSATPASDSYLFGNPAEGKPVPGNDQLAAIQMKFKDATLEKLKQGYTIYNTGACVGCHGAANIYNYDETQWKLIIDDMALRASISDSDKDAVYQYVMSVKGTQKK
jgi:mono/diheme cytochrome c family protein